jgi:hypothetical protein
MIEASCNLKAYITTHFLFQKFDLGKVLKNQIVKPALLQIL